MKNSKAEALYGGTPRRAKLLRALDVATFRRASAARFHEVLLRAYPDGPGCSPKRSKCCRRLRIDVTFAVIARRGDTGVAGTDINYSFIGRPRGSSRGGGRRTRIDWPAFENSSDSSNLCL